MVAAASTAAAAPPPRAAQPCDTTCGDLIKPACDRLGYRCVQLPNRLRLLLISDPETEKAACAMNVRVGSLSDPPELPGLAHFLEHMLFYSSEKYPEEDAYSKFVSEHGGRTNAFTAAEDTNYQFDVNAHALPEALDRFAQFFIAPLISRDGVEREVKAVDSEHAKNINVDAWRLHQLAKATGNQGHPWSHFATGNLETLLTNPTSAGIDVRDAVAAFHAQHYSANLMTAAVYGRQTLDELQALAAAAFGPVVDKGLEAPAFGPDLLLDEHRGLLLRVVPVKDTHLLDITWDIPPTETLYRQAPTSYLSHLLGHEGSGSAFALLKERGWATALSAGEGSGISSRAFFSVRVELTQEGNARVPEVAGVLFRYLALLRGPGGISERIYNEMAGLQLLRFNHRDKPQPYSMTTSLSGAMQHYPDRDLLIALYHVPQEYDPACIQSFLDLLTPSRARITWASRSHEEPAAAAGDSSSSSSASGLLLGLPPPALCSEPIYGTRYEAAPLPAAWLAAWDAEEGPALPELRLPDDNPFVPDNLGLVQPGPGPREGLPQLLLDGPALRLWQRTDLRFETPKAAITLDFQSPAAYASPEAAVCSRLVANLLSDYVNELTYPAELAGLSYGVAPSYTGFQLQVQGYSQKLPLLLDLLVDRLAAFSVRPDRFAVVAEAARRNWANYKYSQVYSWAMYKSDLLLHHKRWRLEDYEAIVSRLTPDDLTAFVPRLLQRLMLEVLVVGNLEPEAAAGIAQGALDKVAAGWGSQPIWPGEGREPRLLKAPAGATSVLVERGPNPSNDNSAIWVNYQVGPDDVTRNALTALLVQLAKREAFASLRTKQQLGYLVHMYVTTDLGVQGICFIIQSDAFPASHLALAVEVFVRQTVARLETLPEDEFVAGVSELAEAKLEKPKTLSSLAHRWATEISAGTYLFDRQVAEVDALRSLTRAELAAFAREVLSPGSPVRRKVAVLVRGSKEYAASSEAPAAAAGAAEVAGSCPASAVGGATAAAAGQCAAPGAAAPAAGTEAPGVCSSNGSGEQGSASVNGDLEYAASAVPAEESFLLVQDVAAFKRSCEVFPAPQPQPATWTRSGSKPSKYKLQFL